MTSYLHDRMRARLADAKPDISSLCGNFGLDGQGEDRQGRGRFLRGYAIDPAQHSVATARCQRISADQANIDARALQCG